LGFGAAGEEGEFDEHEVVGFEGGELEGGAVVLDYSLEAVPVFDGEGSDEGLVDGVEDGLLVFDAFAFEHFDFN